MRKLIGKLLILGGIFSLISASYFYYQSINPNRLSFNGYRPSTGILESFGPETPKYLIIQELGINLPVIPAKIENNKWETTKDGISYLSSSSLPGKMGNSIFYGHNWNSILGNLVKAKPGQLLEIITESGKIEKFIISTIQVVGANDNSVLNSTSDARITLYTCTGFLDSKRLVVTAIKI